ncbi:hypothetical protein UK15_38160 [Streptomyces variegatus]|jgi:hypothetical protein|uniref:Uncharacterized protein n=1 Tax=Streptomyces variegatus TaxID=284040 RepID=A0A0M2GBG6_9ACTN|nr:MULTISPECIES: hypothetical protein [Streptomyces]KJK33936.1 hypothetical protein UK15_38160 [Streptomyces variegatus]
MTGALKDATGTAVIPMHVSAIALVVAAAAVLTTKKHVVDHCLWPSPAGPQEPACRGSQRT